MTCRILYRDRGPAMASRYHQIYDEWKRDPEGFWAAAAEDIDWIKPWDKVFDPEAGVYGRWFAGAECNTCFNAVDRHVAGGRADQLALIYDSPVTGTMQKLHLCASCRREVEALAAVLPDHGVGKGDRVIIYMPMVPEAVFAMLACARHRRRPFRRVRRLRRAASSRPASTTRRPKVDRLGLLRHRARPRRRLQAAARRGDRARRGTSRSAA